MNKKISPAAINALKEALTNIYWYKPDLRSFLFNTLSEPVILNRIDWGQYKRDITANLVDFLTQNQDVYQNDLLKLMTEVVNMKDFSHLEMLDDGKRKAEKAVISVLALSKMMEPHQNLIEEQNKIEERRRVALEESLKRKGVQEKLDEIKRKYLILIAEENSQSRGYTLEKIMVELFELFDLDPRASFKVRGEQIDGAFTFDTTDYLFEAKWQKEVIAAIDLDSFKGKLSRKLENTLGLFLSINGFSKDAVQIHSIGRGMMILMDGNDLWAVLEGRIDLIQLLVRKRRHASQTGEIYLQIHKVL